MEPDCSRFREAAGQGPEAGERLFGLSLVEAADRVCDEGLRVRRGELSGGRELFLSRDRPLEPLQRDPVEQLRTDVVAAGFASQRRELP